MSNLLKSKFLLGVLVVAFMLVGSAVVKTNTVAAASCSITATLKLGSTGTQVICLQTGLGGLTADGSFGPKTKTAVMAWQSGHGLVADGIFGAKSRAAWGSNGGGVPGNFSFITGCISAAGYSTTTGRLCSATTSFPTGCSSTAGYSTITGASCSGGLSNPPAGCANASGFSVTTGVSCSTGLPAVTVRGGGSSGGGGGHRVLSSDATLSVDSMIKGFGPFRPGNLGIPAADIGPGLEPGAIVLSAEQAADDTNTAPHITSFIPTNARATITKVVKYDLADFNPFTFNFDTDAAYNNEAIPAGGSVFIIKVTAEDNSVLYYMIIVGVGDDASLIAVAGQADQTPGGETGADTAHAIAWEVTVANTVETISRLDIIPALFAHSFNLYDDAAFSNEIIGINTIALPVGDTHAYIKITSQDESKTLYYDVTITRVASNVATLNLAVGTGTSLAGVALVNHTTTETGATEILAMPLTVTIANIDQATAVFAPVTTNNQATVEAYADDGTGSGIYAPVAANYNFSTGDTTLWIKVTAEDTTTVLYYKLTVTVAVPTADMLFALTTPAVGEGNGIVTVQTPGERTVEVGVQNGTTSVVITGTKTADQTVAIVGVDTGNRDDSRNITAGGTATAPTYTVNTTTPGDDVHSTGGNKTVFFIVSEAGKADIVYVVNIQVAAPAPSTVHVSDSGTLIAAGINPAVGTIILDNAIELGAALILDNGVKTVDLGGFALTVAGNPITVNSGGELENGDITGAASIGGDGADFLVDGVDFSGTLTTNNSNLVEHNISFHDGSITGVITSTNPAKQFNGTALTEAITPGTGTLFENLTITGAVTASLAAAYDTVVFNGAVTADTNVSTFTDCTFNFAVTNTSGDSNYTGSTFNGDVTNTAGDASYNGATFSLTSTLTVTAGSPTFVGTVFAEAVAEADKITALALGTITVGDTDTVLEKAQALVDGAYTVTVKTADGVAISPAGVAIGAGEGTIIFTVTKGVTPFTADTPMLDIAVQAGP